MKIIKKLTALVLVVLLTATFSGCKNKDDYDVSAYIRNVLSSAYKGVSIGTDKIATDTSNTDAENYNQTTAENATVRFFEKYKINASEAQIAAMNEVFKTAYSNSKYSVSEKTETSYGFDVAVKYDIQTTFLDLESDINKRRDEAVKDGTALEIGAKYIDGIVALCKNSADVPTYDGSETVNFDIKVDEDQNLSLNIKLFDKIDKEILPV